MSEHNRDQFQSRWGFIMSCIGSAVGMGNIWLFPTRVSAYGGGTYIIPYLICVMLLGYSGIIGEIGLGRSTRNGSVGAFGKALASRGHDKKLGNTIGLLPVVSSLLLAIGYTVVTGWIFKYWIGTFTGSTIGHSDIDGFGGAFGATASPFGNTIFQIIAAVIVFTILTAGIANGIEKTNKFMMPAFYLLFIGLGIYVFFQPGSEAGYSYIFRLDIARMFTPEVWIFALGQAFFSLSLGGSGTVIYGSYFSDAEDVIGTAKTIAFFDTLAALTASLVIIPAMATAGLALDTGGPGLMFVSLPHLFSGMPGGGVVAIVFFTAVMFAAITSLINLYELPIATLQEVFNFTRAKAVIAIALVGIAVSLVIQGIVGEWMDVVSIYINPLGALLAGIMFYWVFGMDYAKNELSKGREKPIGNWLDILGKYAFVGITIFVYIAGIMLGGIG